MWRDGLLYKLRRIGIGKNVYSFIRDFLSNRTFQVRVGGSLSKIVPMENGSPQCSVISPLLFLIMMNNYPLDVHGGSRLALFADDSSVYKSGSSLKYITNSIQIYLKNIFKWCDKWGFKISYSKTICVLFTRRHNISPIPIAINGHTLQYEKNVKFLGMMFDSRLTWNDHAQYIANRCTTPLKLMRCITGKSWGMEKKSCSSCIRH